MLNVSVARRYARALIAVATEAGEADAALAALSTLAHAVESSAELADLFTNPGYTRTQRWSVVEGLLGAVPEKSTVLNNTLRLMNDRDRLMHLPRLARMFRDMADERAGRVRGKVVSAVALSAESMAQLADVLQRAVQKNVLLESRVETRVLGGASAQVGSLVFDGTLRSQLEAMRRQLKGT